MQCFLMCLRHSIVRLSKAASCLVMLPHDNRGKHLSQCKEAAQTVAHFLSTAQTAAPRALLILLKKGESVSTRVSPVLLVGCIPTGHITVDMASCPHAPLHAQGKRWGVLPFRGGTFCLVARGLSPGEVIISHAKCPLTWRPGFAIGVHRGGPSCCALTLTHLQHRQN